MSAQRLRVRAFDSLESCASIHEEMARLNEASPRPCPFSTVEFLTNHIEHNGVSRDRGGGRVLLLTAFRGDTLAAYLPLRKVRDRVLGRVREKIEFLVTNDLDRPHLVARGRDERECADAFCRHLLENEPDWTFLEFQQQDEASPLHAIRASLDSDAYYARSFENAANATIDVTYPSLEAYFRAMSKKMRNNVGRYARRLFDAGDVQLVSSSAPEAMPGMLDVYRSVEQRSWKRGIDWVVGDEPERLAFFQGLMRRGQPMRIGVEVIVLDGRPIAGIINGRFGDRMYALQIAYDVEHAELDPGAMVLLASMKRAIDQKCVSYDLLSGYGYFKERWLARITPSRSIQIYRTGSLHHLKAVLGEYRRHLAGSADAQATAKSNPVKEAIVDAREFAIDAAATHAQRAEGARVLEHLLSSSLPVDSVSHDQLVAAMPFATRSFAATG